MDFQTMIKSMCAIDIRVQMSARVFLPAFMLGLYCI